MAGRKQRMKDIKDHDLQAILNSQKGKSKTHVSKIRMVIKDVFSQAYASRKIPFDPSTKLSLPDYSEGKHRSITDEEREVLEKVAQTHRCGLWVRFLLGTGIRPGETPPLLVSDLDFDKKLVSISKSLESGAYAVGDPKTAAGIRKVSIPDDLIKDLKKVGSDRAIIKSTRRISVDPKKINCDLTKLLSGDIRAINTFKGEYMIDYSWAQSGSTADLLRGAS